MSTTHYPYVTSSNTVAANAATGWAGAAAIGYVLGHRQGLYDARRSADRSRPKLAGEVGRRIRPDRQEFAQYAGRAAAAGLTRP